MQFVPAATAPVDARKRRSAPRLIGVQRSFPGNSHRRGSGSLKARLVSIIPAPELRHGIDTSAMTQSRRFGPVHQPLVEVLSVDRTIAPREERRVLPAFSFFFA